MIVGLAVVLERPRYAPGSTGDRGRRAVDGGERFAATDEVFIDPTTGDRMRVWADPETGDRQYRPDPG